MVEPPHDYGEPMSSADVDECLARLPEPQRTTLATVRARLGTLLPEATEGLSYGVPCLKVRGKAVAGFPTSKGALKFAIDTPLPVSLVRTLVPARLDEING